MIRHIAMFTFNDGVAPDAIDAIDSRLAELPGLIDEIVEYCFGRDLRLTDTTADYAVVADFATEADYATYSAHPAHVAVVREVIAPVVAAISRVQFEID
ncbi:MAG: Dabb family protein [Acidimicrobiia bacterium]